MHDPVEFFHRDIFERYIIPDTCIGDDNVNTTAFTANSFRSRKHIFFAADICLDV